MAKATIRRLLGGVLAGAVVTSALVGGVATAAVAADSTCAPVTVLAFRGSGETNLVPAVTTSAGANYAYAGSDLITNGWEGPTLQRLIGQFAPEAVAAGIPVLGVGAPDAPHLPGYPAIAADPTEVASLSASAQAGAVAAELIIKKAKSTAAASSCAYAPRFIAIGYSQGALAARVLAQLNPIDVVGVVTIGDPTQQPNAVGNVGTGAAGDGLLRWLSPHFGDTFDGVYAQNTATAALCHAGDPVCDFGWTSIWRVATGAYENHAYFVSEADRAPTLQAMASLVSDARLNPVAAVSPALAPTVQAAASALAIEGAPTVISAVGSQSADPLVTYEFDFGDDVQTNQTGLAFAPVRAAGEYPVAVTVTDLIGRSTTITLQYTVAPAAAAVPKASFAQPSILVAEQAPVVVGTSLPLVLQGAPADSALTAMLVPTVSASPWDAEPAFATQLADGWQATGIAVPATLTPGLYYLVVGAETGGWGTTLVTVMPAPTPDPSPVTEPPVTTPPAAAGTPAPVTPVTVPAAGQASSTLNGQADAVTVSRNAANTRVTLTGTDFSLTLGGLNKAGDAIVVGANTVLVLEHDGSVTVSADGFAPNSEVGVYLFSTATSVGTATTTAAGTFNRTFAVPAIRSGPHTLQVVGLAPNGSARVLNLGVRVEDAPASASVAGIPALAVGGVNPGGALGAALLVLLVGLGLTVVRSRRVSATA
ncbi:PKD domain-containing protein [Cryobacterium frigoriphilum]|nr:PKD domain-containing protein [Cryobacterium frigoriphilum]